MSESSKAQKKVRPAAKAQQQKHDLPVCTKRGVIYDGCNFVPMFLKNVPTNQQALLYHFDLEALFCTFDLDIKKSRAADPKKNSLRKMFGKSKIPDESTKQRDKETDSAATASETLSQEQRKCVLHEIERLTKHVMENTDMFVILFSVVSNLRDAELLGQVHSFAEYLMLGHSVTQHRCMSPLNMFDVSLLVELGRTQLWSHVLSYTLSQGYTRHHAERRMGTALNYANAFLSDECQQANLPSNTKSVELIERAVPAFWSLHHMTHTPLSDRERTELQQQAMKEFPLLVIGALYFMSLDHEKENVIQRLIKSSI